MTTTLPPHDELIQVDRQDEQAAERELQAGLLAPQAAVSPKFLYDALGSKLFEAICELPEYYPTRTEGAIIDKHVREIAQSVGPGCTLIDLGAGNCAKAARLFPWLRPRQYVPVDISVDFLRDALLNLRQRFPEICVTGVGMDFSASLRLPLAVGVEKRLFFYPGSSIGNFPPDQALSFLERVRTACGTDGGILIGVDLVKEGDLLDAAYDDALGVTAAFNLNLLLHVNRLLGADFMVRDWRHVAHYDAARRCVDMHLEARRAHVVRWHGAERGFAAGERIHTESSYKYTRTDFLQLLERAGFCSARVWTDERGWFMVCHARVA